MRYANGKYDVSVYYSSADQFCKCFSHADIILKRVIMQKNISQANYRQI